MNLTQPHIAIRIDHDRRVVDARSYCPQTGATVRAVVWPIPPGTPMPSFAEARRELGKTLESA